MRTVSGVCLEMQNVLGFKGKIYEKTGGCLLPTAEFKTLAEKGSRTALIAFD